MHISLLAEWIRGSKCDHIQNLLERAPTSSSHGIGRTYQHTVEIWRKIIRAAWVQGLLERKMIQGKHLSQGWLLFASVYHSHCRCCRKAWKSTAMNALVPATYSDAFVEDPTPVLLPKQTLHLDHVCISMEDNI